nr:hypothetical protein [Haloplanus sp. HW8-1]
MEISHYISDTLVFSGSASGPILIDGIVNPIREYRVLVGTATFLEVIGCTSRDSVASDIFGAFAGE